MKELDYTDFAFIYRSSLAVKKLKIKIYKEVTGFTAVIKYLSSFPFLVQMKKLDYSD